MTKTTSKWGTINTNLNEDLSSKKKKATKQTQGPNNDGKKEDKRE